MDREVGYRSKIPLFPKEILNESKTEARSC